MRQELQVEDYRLAADNDRLGHIPGSYGIPYFGHAVRTTNDFLAFLREQYRRYGPVSRTATLNQRMLVLLGPELNQQILLDRERNFSSEMGYEWGMAPFFHGGLMLRDFDDHKVQRRIMQTAFKTDAMRKYIDIMDPILAKNMDAWQGQEKFLFHNEIRGVLLGVAAQIFIGVDDLGEEAEYLNQAFLDTVGGLTSLVRFMIPGNRYYKAIKGRARLESYFRGMLPAKRQGDGVDMFSYFCRERREDGELFSDDDVIDHICFLMMAAHDTTTSALSSAVLELALDQDLQETIRAECRALGSEFLPYDELESGQQLDMFFHEVLRFHAPVPMSLRRTVRDCELGGYAVPKHTVLSITSTFAHYMEEWWEEPFRFDPQRFSPQRAEHKRHSFQFIPFGGGAHKCMGLHFAAMQTKCFLHRFLQKYRLRLPANYRIEYQEMPFPYPRDHLPVVLEPLH